MMVMNLRAVDTEGDQDARHSPEPDPRPREPFTASSSTFQKERSLEKVENHQLSVKGKP